MTSETELNEAGLRDRQSSAWKRRLARRVLPSGHPSARIEDVQNVELVFKQGVGYDSPKIFESVKGRVGLH